MPAEVVAIAYEDAGGGERAARYLREQSEGNQVALDEVAVVTLDDSGTVHAAIGPPEVSERLGGGAVGAIVGGIVGVLLGPIGAIAGIAAGGAIGAHEASHHGAVDDEFLSALGDALTPGGSAIVVAAEMEELAWLSGHVPDELRGRLVRTTLSDEQVARLRELGSSAT